MFKREIKTVRIWIWWKNSPVKIALKRDEEVEFYSRYSTEEGSGWESETYEWDSGDNVIRCSVGSGGMDCDGRHEYSWDGFWRIGGPTCPMLDFECEPPRDLGIQTPDWERESSWQRDYAAEAAGY
jgi:hypothetical protein